MTKFILHWITISLLAVSGVANAGPHDHKVRTLLTSDDAAWLYDPLLIEAVKRQNTEHSSLGQRDIDRLDKTWRSEKKSSKKPTINSILNNELSEFLKTVAAKSDGLYSEIIVMDNKGLNVGQSKITSDYWQGDEDKWKKTFLAGQQALYIDKIEYDDSARSFQIQASVPVVDPTTKTNIGAVTIGLSMRKLALRPVE